MWLTKPHYFSLLKKHWYPTFECSSCNGIRFRKYRNLPPCVRQRLLQMFESLHLFSLLFFNVRSISHSMFLILSVFVAQRAPLFSTVFCTGIPRFSAHHAAGSDFKSTEIFHHVYANVCCKCSSRFIFFSFVFQRSIDFSFDVLEKCYIFTEKY